MACSACSNKISTKITCLNCGKTFNYRHKKEQDPIKKAKETRFSCNRCFGREFE